MSTTPQTTLQLARQGNPDAIAALMNRHLEVQGITAQVAQQDGTLHVSLEADHVPNQSDLVAYVKKGIAGLELAHINHLTVIARQPGTEGPAWSEDLSLQPQPGPLGTEFTSASNNDFDLDFDLDGPALEVQSLDDLDAVLDNGLNGTDLDFDLGFIDSDDAGRASTDDFDLGFADSPGDLNFGETSAATESTDFDLSLTDDDLGFDLGLDNPSAPDTGLDFDLGLTDAAAETSADAADLDFDLEFADPPPEASADLDFDLEFDDSPPGTSADLDFDLGFDDSPAEDLSFDLDLAEPVSLTSADATDLDFDLGVSPTDPNTDFDLGLGLESEATPLTFEPVDLSFASDTDLAADLDFDAEEAADFSLDFGSVEDTEAAIAAPDGADCDFTPADPSDTLAADLDDLWDSDNTDAASPDLGLTAAADSSNAWETDVDFLPLDDTAPLEDDVLSSPEPVASGDDLVDLGFEPIPEGFEPEGFEPEGFETVEFDLTDLGSDALAEDAFVAATLDAEALGDDALGDDAIAIEDMAFPDLDLSSETGLEDLSPELLPSEAVVFADLGSAEALDLSSPDGEAAFSDLSPSTPVDGDLDSYLASSPEELVADQLDWASTDTPGVDLELSDDLDLYVSNEDEQSTDPLADLSAGATPDLAWNSGLELAVDDDAAFVSDTTPWGEGELDSDLALDNPEDAGFDLGNEFDPGLVFDPAAVTTGMAEASVFTNDDFTTSASGFVDSEPGLAAAEPDFLFDSTMELDETLAGDFIVPGEFGDDAASLVDSPFAEGDEAGFVDLGFDGTDEDLAFESVELGAEDLEPGYGAAGFADVGLGQTDLGEVSFNDESFDDESFEDESFDTGLFSEGASDSNGFTQDPDSVLLNSGEPDATDDFILEFGTDPSTHVSLTPEQFDKDGSVKSSGGSGLPMRLILGLGLGALILTLAGLLLNGLLGRMRQPTPGEPVVTEPEVSAPDSPTPPPTPDSPAPPPAPVAETDFFREAVNAAQTAANQAQTAGTSAQWQEVADSWARAIDLMQQVPQSDPNYAVAQQKAVEYQPNRNYAQQNADRL